MTRDIREVDLLIIGSGPAGATYARKVGERVGGSILMVEAGPMLTQPPGRHVTSLPEDEKAAMYRAAQGLDDVDRSMEAFLRGDPPVAHPGVYLVGGDQMPLASISTGVGGMGAFWNCGMPTPTSTERIPFIPAVTWDDALAEAKHVMHARLVATNPIVDGVLADAFEPLLGPDLQILPLDTAQRTRDDGTTHGVGPADILEPLTPLPAGFLDFELRADTVCTAVHVSGDRASGATLRDRRTGESYDVRARVVVIAGGSFRTPQLLWASGIRPDALGRHLMDHPRSLAMIEVDPDRVPDLANAEDRTGSATRVAFSDPGNPYLGIVSHGWSFSGWSGISRETRYDGRGGFVSVDWTGRTEARPENRVVFSDAATDWLGLPSMTIEFELSPRDRAEFDGGLGLIQCIADHFGDFVPGQQPRQMPLGTHLHYQGTVRMGDTDDGTSVCDSSSRVWGYRNLFVAGNGVIPTATACNPTLMNVTLAVLGSRAVIEMLDRPVRDAFD